MAEKSRALVCAAATLVAVLFVLVDSRSANAATFEVDSTANTNSSACTAAANDCTLRGAINASNASTTADDTINFAIPDDPGVPGLEVKTISLTSILPAINDTVTINGYSQGGAAANSATTNANSAVLKIELSGGASALANAFGLAVSGADAAGTTIKGLVINRFGDDGVFVNAPGTVIEGNFIGTNADGDAALGNGADGVNLLSSGNVVGGPANAAQNVISGNGENGVAVKNSDATGNTISNNHIGTDADASEDLGNSQSGVFVENAPNNTIGGSNAEGTLNIISGNDEHGVEISNIGASGTRVLGNLIGVNLNGNGSDIGNTLDGVRVSSTPQVEIGGTSGTTPGGPCAGVCNVISDNGQHGVEIVGTSSTSNKVQGNRIGTDDNGASDFGNARDGVHLGNVSNNTIGGTSEAARNVISGNEENGVFVDGTSSATFNRIQGNHLGINASGTNALGNTLNGVRIRTPETFVGGTAAGAGNVISGNVQSGVFITGPTSETTNQNNKVEGNLIGTDANGTSDLGNGARGVHIEARGNFVGGTVAEARNVISGNGGSGVLLNGSNSANNLIQGNHIGTDVNGTGALGNQNGVSIGSAPGNTIGGTVDAAANTIAFNAEHGVLISNSTVSTRNRIVRNSIFDNGLLGINLSGGTETNGAVTNNDPKDPDLGPNKLQNFPVITSATTTKVTGKLNSRPGKTFTIQLFSNPAPNFPTLFGEGETFVRQKTVKTDRKGKATFTITASLVAGQIVSATATDSVGNTSEFSQGRTVG